MYIYLSALIVICSSLWVIADSLSKKIPMSQRGYTAFNGPIAWGILCLALWLAGFPLYLVRRHGTLTERGEAGKAKAGTRIGVCVILAWIAVVALSLFTVTRVSDEELTEHIRNSISTAWSKDDRMSAAKIDELTLIHGEGNEYQGVMKFHLGQESSTVKLDITYDGTNFTWEIK